MAIRADETWSHSAELNHAVMELLMEELDTRCGLGSDTCCGFIEQLLAAFQAIEDGDEDLARKIIKATVDDLDY